MTELLRRSAVELAGVDPWRKCRLVSCSTPASHASIGQPRAQRDRDARPRYGVGWAEADAATADGESSARCTAFRSRTKTSRSLPVSEPQGFADHGRLRTGSTTASIVQRLRVAGAVTIGKTNTPEFGAGSQTFNPVFGATRNPYDLGSYLRWVERGGGGRPRDGHDADRRRFRHRRIPRNPRRSATWSASTLVWPCPLMAENHALVGTRYVRRDGLNGRRPCTPAAGARRARPAGADLVVGARLDLR